MESIKIKLDKIYDFVSKNDVFSYKNEISKHILAIENKTGKGNDFLGWLDLPSSISETEISKIEKTAALLKSKVEILVVIGIGGSYLGSKAVIEALSNSFEALNSNRKNPLVVFAGQNISEDYTHELIDLLDTKSYGIVVISKSGTTTEPAIAFRILKNHIEKKYGKEEAKQRIVAVTDAKRGALKQVANNEGYTTFDIADDIGGRYSVLTAVGLLPIAVAGFNIRKLIDGAKHIEKNSGNNVAFEENICAVYAAARNALYEKGKTNEILVNYVPKLHFVAEWWKQLYGESEGKENKGIFPASVDFTSDLHSMGQYIQEGLRNIFETVISIKEPNSNVAVPTDSANIDGLNFIAGKRIDEVNKMAELGTMIAHVDGGVPNIRIELPKLNEYYIGQTLYFFEKACAISGYILDVNPFDQPGVEAYKKNMFALLGKPGFEKETEEIRKRI
ncbi:MAG TPA: glucose-6-phosphate isomerase [Bacteroidales bacterium]|nr:MAG: glucose-6-phosphate isomerase [Bacteroidetes bacterium GWF2_33_38]OFY88826.1 MAG: glucose-6-phosphate isomerase [Bacteroidetes bacterium RIFOXYA2_FULL_33_7]HBF89417.1 glucose-6-phosphate isomerase [Bacteroidales bacterium]